MKRRQIYIVAGVLVLVLAIFLSSRLGEEEQEEAPPREEKVYVEVLQVKPDTVQSYVTLTGRVIPRDRIEIFAEVGGIFIDRGTPFKVGYDYRQGEVLVQIDSEEARQRMVSSKSAYMNVLAQVVPDLKIDFPEIYEPWRDYLVNFNVNGSLKPLPKVNSERQQLFLTGRNVYSQYYALKEQETQLGNYIIRAPFAGTLTEVLINEGTLVRVGQKLGEYIKTDVYELEAAISPSELQYLSKGDQVQLQVPNSTARYTGKISRINASIDNETQTVLVYIQVSDPKLKAGMYLTGKVKAQQFEQAVRLPRDVLVNGKSIYVVQDSTAKLQPAQVLKFTSDEVILGGLPEGALVMETSENAAFEGTKVTYQLKR
ncbi:efflux RND transporter periplasmic adaptor subunit [Pontibacter cellulosilyticus]|uniref:Efflux RND transporter periplasmic adaptor subunit n=1 Tax=Pontibacter cellulosilyticus TaxID=1720253 RepID=A0A923SM69_9BACT|nr:efflux RND transporter periplasmic adaptor subunit [Pontibacter cellulosilyticus]MBC5991885.1 efflux RND transporter periplasmic adaptor subunit [Pontibacter cellulosilyticus]